MKKLLRPVEIIFLLSLAKLIYGELLTSRELHDRALKNYPSLLYNDMETYMQRIKDNPRRFSSYPFYGDILKNPYNHITWYKHLMAFAHDATHFLKVGKTYDKVRTCYCIATTYTGAIYELRKYFEVRFLYQHDLDYEVGFMTHEILSKYQRMLELFYLVRKRFYHAMDRNRAPVKWVLYIYLNMIELSTVIIHLCNMLHELKYKYMFDTSKQSVFADYHLGSPSKFYANESLERERSINLFELQKRREKKRQERAMKKYLQKFPPITKWTYRPYKKNWPLTYGWSIERW